MPAVVPAVEPAVEQIAPGCEEQLAPLGEGARALPVREEGGCVRAAGAHAATCAEEVAAAPWGNCEFTDDDSGWSSGGGFTLKLPTARFAACTDACCAASTCVCCVSARLVTNETQLWKAR